MESFGSIIQGDSIGYSTTITGLLWEFSKMFNKTIKGTATATITGYTSKQVNLSYYWL